MRKYDIFRGFTEVGLMALLLALFSCGGGGGGGGYAVPGGTSNAPGAQAPTVEVVACPASGTTNVAIADFGFTPASASVGLNSVVKWTNNGAVAHTVTSSASGIDASVAAGGSVCLKFSSAGTFSYHCSVHPSMTGTITVSGTAVASGGTGGATGGTGGTTTGGTTTGGGTTTTTGGGTVY